MKTYNKVLAVAVSILATAALHAQNTSTAGLGGANYISKNVFTEAGGAASVRDVVYYDGLGYPVQELSLDANTGHGTLVRPIVYDNMRRDDATVYLPYTVQNGGGYFVRNAVTAQQSFYGQHFGDTDAYSFKEYESSSVGRVLSAMREGKEYRAGDGHRTGYTYALNGTDDAVMRMTYDYPSGDIASGGITVRGPYPVKSLQKLSVTDEDGCLTDSYTTPRGLTVCTRTWLSATECLETHYVYDLKDSLVCVIQPEGMKTLQGRAAGYREGFGSELAREQFFLYRYDGEGHVIESQVPGGGVSEYAYDERGRLVAFASAEMAEHGLYRMTQYDELDRVTEERYVRFADGDASSIRASLRTWTGLWNRLPQHTVVGRTYSATYSPFYQTNFDDMIIPSGTIQDDPGNGLPRPRTNSNTVWNVTDNLSEATVNRMNISAAEASVGNDDSQPKTINIAKFVKVDISDAVLKKAEIMVTKTALEFEADEYATGYDEINAYNKGMLSEETISSVPSLGGDNGNVWDSLSRTRAYFYDYRGNVVQMRELDSDGWAACYSTRYDFAGNVTGTIESHTSPTGETHRVKTELTLDKRGNVLRERIYADGTLVTDTEYTYDELMRPTGRVTTGSGGSVLTETTTLDIRGWRTAHSASRRGEALYSQELAYMNPSQGAAPRWTGLISEATTAQLGSSPNTFGYSYDSVGRLTAAGSAKGSENGIRYDANGNMTALRRLPAAGAATADLTMAYSGNRLASVTNSGAEQPGSFSYEYDSNGNMTKDSRKSLEFSHNVLNLPMTVSSLAGSTVTNTMTYTYLGDGTRVGARVSNPDAQGYSGMRYRGSFVYDVTADGVHSLQSVAVSTGRLIALTGTNGAVSFESDGFITDHLGNVAAVVNLSAPASTSNANVILEQDEYYPFGTKMENAGMKTQATNRYRYAGKEEQDIAGMDLGLLDFGARYYDAYVGRWNAIDPLAHKYFGMSPYNYCGNDPVNKFDPDGRETFKSFLVNSDKQSKKRNYDNDCLNSKTQYPDFTNILTVAAHGCSSAIEIAKGEKSEILPAEKILTILYQETDLVNDAINFNRHCAILLMSCSTGKNGDNSVAAELSSLIKGSIIIAPSGTVSVSREGKSKVEGCWCVFMDGHQVSTVTGTEKNGQQYWQHWQLFQYLGLLNYIIQESNANKDEKE